MPQRLLLTLLLATAIHTSAAGQVAFEARRDSLHEYWAAGDTLGYYQKLKECAIIAANNYGDITLLESLEPFIDPDPSLQNPQKSKRIRFATMHMGSRAKALGEFKKAQAYYLISHRHVKDPVRLDEWTWYIESELSNIYTRFGDFENAAFFAHLTESSLRWQASSGNLENTIGLLSRFHVNEGLIHESAGNWNNAIADYKRGLLLADSISYSVGIQSNAVRLASLYTDLDSLELAQHYLSRADSALQHLSSVKNYLERSADVTFTRARWLQKRSRQDTSAQERGKCLPAFRESIDQLGTYQSNGRTRESAKYLIAYSKALMAVSDMNAAKDALAMAQYQLRVSDSITSTFPYRSDLYKENTFIELYGTWSAWHEIQYSATGDLTHLTRSIAALDLARQANDILLEDVAADPSKLIAIRTNRSLVQQELATVYKLHQVSGDPALMNKARELFNRSKSLLLDEKLRESGVVADLSDSEKDSLRLWQNRLQRAQAHQHTANPADTMGRAIIRLRDQIDSLIGLKRQELEAEHITTDYVEYAVLPDSILAIASIHGETVFRRLGARNDFIRLQERFNEYIGSHGSSLDTLVCRELYDFLIRPLTDSVPARLVVIPDGEIGYIPFDLLVADDGTQLIARSLVSTAYAYAYPAPAARHDESLAEVICLAPSYPKSPYQLAASRGTFYHLPFARMEADSIRGLYGARAILSTAATDEAVLDQMGKARIFHYAGHAVADGPDAYIALSAENAAPYRLTAEELAQAGLGPDLAVLSACETGLGQLAPGEGIMSLGRSFLASGARATVMTLWTVHDGMTARIMIDFHKHLRRGLPIDAALRNAKLDYLATAEHEARHPYFWAGIVAAGDMDVLRR